jgi:hypothetical protein
MNIHDFHTLTGIACLACLGTKIILHIYLDYILSKKVWLAWLTPLKYFLPYKVKVVGKYAWWKSACNFLLWLSVFSLFLNAMAGLLIYMQQ